MNTEEYVPDNIPTNKPNAKSFRVWFPRIRRAITGNKVVKMVLIDLINVLFIE